MTRRKFISLAALAAATGIGGLAVARNVQRNVAVTYHEVPLSPETAGIRIVHLTDLHLGWGAPPALVDEMVALCHDAEPDLVVLTGDYVNHSLKHIERVRAVAAQLPRPSLGTLGNHDYYAGAEEVQRVLEAEGVQVLANEHCLVATRGGRCVPIVAVDDSFSGHDDMERAFAGLDGPGGALGLTHFPNAADEMVARGSRFVLAGHTHGGQIGVPLVTPALARTIGNRYLAGWYDVGERGRLYVNAGIGSSASRWRVGRGTASEVAVIDLV